MKRIKTLRGIEFDYDGSLENGLIIHKRINIVISNKIISIIKSEIIKRSPVLMGACRDNPSKNSLGSFLREHGYSPQFLSYVIPLLVEEGFCHVNDKKPFLIAYSFVANSKSS